MKIAITTDLYYPMINGVAVFSRNLASGLASRGHEVLVLAPSTTGQFEYERDPNGFRVARFSSVKFPFYPDQITATPQAKELFGVRLPQVFYKNGLNVSWYPYQELKEVFAQFAPDLIHSQTPGPVAWAVYYWAHKYDVPLVATGHCYPDNLTGNLKIFRIAKKPLDAVMRRYFVTFLAKAAHATMPTQLAIADLIPHNRHSFKVKVEALSNGIDLSRFKPGVAPAQIYKKYQLTPGVPTVLYVGRLDPEKSLEVLVRAFAQVKKKIPQARLVLVGDGADRQRLEELTHELGLDQDVHFLGRIVGSQLPLLYRLGNVFAITSTTETQSIVLMEAMASGLPAVAMQAGALGELVKNGKNGWLCAPGKVEAVAKGLIKILKDPALARKMGQHSLQLVKKHDVGHTMDRLEAIYQDVLTRKKTGTQEPPAKIHRQTIAIVKKVLYPDQKEE